MKDQPGMTKRSFSTIFPARVTRRTGESTISRPRLGERFLAFLIRILPKFGPLKVLQLRTPTPETERMFEAKL